MRISIIFFLICLLYACVPPTDGPVGVIDLDYNNEKYQKILNNKDERRGDLLMDYFSSPFVTERFLAAEAFSSIKGEIGIDPLLNLLNTDPSEEVRFQAAYALGQIGDSATEAPLVNSFANQDSTNQNNKVRMAILEAIGKLGSLPNLENIATVSTYTAGDNYLLLGQARAIYRFGLRGITSPKATKRMVAIVLDNTMPEEARLIAAHYLYRTRDIDLAPYELQIANELTQVSEEYIRMALVGAIGKSSQEEIGTALLSQLSREEDYRVKVNILRGLKNQPFVMYRDSIVPLLSSDNKHVALTAAQLVEDHAEANQSTFLFNLLKSPLTDEVKAKLYGGILKSVPYYFANTRKRASDEIIQHMDAVSSPYLKANYLKALAYDPINYPHIETKGLKSSENVLMTTAVSVIPQIMTSPKFNQIFRTTAAREKVSQDILGYIKEVYQGGNVGAIAAASAMLRSDDLGYKDELSLKSTMRDALLELTLPKDLEAKYEIEATIAFMEGREYVKESPDYNHPIEWNVLKDISDSSRVYIVTTHGQVELELYKSHAPGSVANFVNLVNQDFYDNNTIHRVVPNFVVQAGCPRGDGYGALDYSIRSEVGPKYYDDEGYVGMASAGPDTEGTQWFITHSPTPHLDGNYTIFAKVLSGMDVVHKLQIGDKILDIRILRAQ